MNIISRLFVFTSIMFVVVACGGGGSTSSSNKGTGYLVDSAVDGASYVCSPSGKSGVTGTDGQYQCTAGDTVVFSLGDIKLPSIPAQSFVTVLDLAGVAKTTGTRAVGGRRSFRCLRRPSVPGNAHHAGRDRSHRG